MKGKVLCVTFIVLAAVLTGFASAQDDVFISSATGANVSALADDGDYLWVGSDWGLTRLHKTTGDIELYNERLGHGLPSEQITALAIDPEGTVWIGTEGGGAVSYDGTAWTVYNTENSDLPHNNINDLAIDTQGNIWVGTQWGMAKFDGENWTVYNTDNSGLMNNKILALAADTDGSIWAGTTAGLAKFDGETWKEWETGILAGAGTWSRRADMPTARFGHSSIVLDGKIYAIGGEYGPPSYSGFTKVEEYNPATDTWTTKANMITGRKYLSACALNGKIYVFGGTAGNHTSSLSSVEEYDPATDIWMKITNMPSVLAGSSAALLNGKLYVIGGTLTSPPVNVVSSVYVYDPGGEPDEPTWVDDMIPVEFELEQNYPNPFNPATTINYRMVNLVIYDLLGRKVTTLVDEMRTPGNYTVTWNARNFASGIYFYRI